MKIAFILALFLGLFSQNAYAACDGGTPNGNLNFGEECDDGNTDNDDICMDDCRYKVKKVPIHVCSGDGDLYLYRDGNLYQDLNVSFAVDRDTVTIFTKNGLLYLSVEVNGVGVSFDTFITAAGPVLYQFTTNPGDTVSIKGNSKIHNPTGIPYGASAIQGYLAQDSSALISLPENVEWHHNDADWNEMYLVPDTYSYIFFEKYTYGNPQNFIDGEIDTRQINVSVTGPFGVITDKTYTTPWPQYTEGVVVDTYTVNPGETGLYNLSLSTTDSIYLVFEDCQNTCGDTNLDAGEQCDDGNLNNGDGCDSACNNEICGNSILQPWLGEQCDDGNVNNCDGCDSVCNNEVCGNSILQPCLGEQCDDGNVDNGDGCDSACNNEICGNSILQPWLGEQCDDGNVNNGDGCDSGCIIEYCGDGTIQPGLGEQCDDSNIDNYDLCQNDCQLRMVEVPVSSCTADAELYLYRDGNPFQDLNTSFIVDSDTDEVLVFSVTPDPAFISIKVDGIGIVPAVKTFLNDITVYSIAIPPGTASTVSIDGTSAYGAKNIQGCLAQNSSDPIYNFNDLQIGYAAVQAQDQFLAPGTYSYIFFDKYSRNNDGTPNNQQLSIKVSGPAGTLLDTIYTQPSPIGTEGVITDTFTVPPLQSGVYTLDMSTSDSIYWPINDCPPCEGIADDTSSSCECYTGRSDFWDPANNCCEPADCWLSTDNTWACVDGYRLDGLGFCDLMSICGDIHYWNGSAWADKMPDGCSCYDSEECECGTCIAGICLIPLTPNISFSLKSISGELGSNINGVIIIKSNLPTGDSIKLSIHTSPEKIIYWSAFENGETEIVVDLDAYEEKSVLIEIFAGELGTYDIKIIANSLLLPALYAEDNLDIHVVEPESEINSRSPGLKWLSIFLILLAAIFIYKKKHLK